MPGCAVFTCKKRSSTSNMRKEGITYHLFPTDDFYRKIWISSCNNHPSWLPTRSSTICSRHFEPAQIITLPGKKRKLVDWAIPTLYLTDPNIKLKEDDASADQDSGSESSQANTSGSVHVHVLVPPPDADPQAKSIIEKKLIRRIHLQSKKIKSLQSKVRYYKKKVVALEDILKQFQVEPLMDSDDSPSEE